MLRSSNLIQEKLAYETSCVVIQYIVTLMIAGPLKIE